MYPQQWGAHKHCPSPRVTRRYSSIAAALHAETEDCAAEARSHDESGDDAESDAGNPMQIVAAVEPRQSTVLGSAFHAACQWLIEMGADAFPARADAGASVAPDAGAARTLRRCLNRWPAGCSCRPARVAVHSREVPFFHRAARTGHRSLRRLCRRRHRRFGDEPGGFVTRWSSTTRRAAHRRTPEQLQEARPAGARLR
ncbi:MAG: hypothetical protein ACLRM9_03850 [Collinsella aerofaciens]